MRMLTRLLCVFGLLLSVAFAESLSETRKKAEAGDARAQYNLGRMYHYGAAEFHKREGHCVVPRGLEDNGIDIARWVTTQRSKKDSLTPDQLKRLNAFGFS
jgi:hypothetical protein